MTSDTLTRPNGRLVIMPHREIPVQVTAWIDEGVAELVTALNAIPGLLTLDSCQEDPGDGLARVTFCTHDETMLYETVSRIARAIGTGPRDHVRLSLWWGCDEGPPVADLQCPPSLVAHVARQLALDAGEAHG